MNLKLRSIGTVFLAFLTAFCLFSMALGLVSSFADAQTAVVVSPWPQFVSYLQNGQPNAFGCVFTYEIASTTPLSTFTDYSGVTENSNPVILSAGGTANVWIQSGNAYRYLIKSAGGSNCRSGGPRPE